jgi:PIN domain nuclease of toxin-antitoxin system
MIFLDTHAVVWLYQDTALLPDTVLASINSGDTFVSPMVALELEYLFEIGRIRMDSRTILDYLAESIDLKIEERTFTRAVLASRQEKWTRDPFDRIITAHASVCKAPLATRDERIRKAYPASIWD